MKWLLQNAEGSRDSFSPLCVRATMSCMHNKPGSVSRVNISQQEALLLPYFLLAADTHDPYTVICMAMHW